MSAPTPRILRVNSSGETNRSVKGVAVRILVRGGVNFLKSQGASADEVVPQSERFLNGEGHHEHIIKIWFAAIFIETNGRVEENPFCRHLKSELEENPHATSVRGRDCNLVFDVERSSFRSE